jgi:hypothetical protein
MTFDKFKRIAKAAIAERASVRLGKQMTEADVRIHNEENSGYYMRIVALFGEDIRYSAAYDARSNKIRVRGIERLVDEEIDINEE